MTTVVTGYTPILTITHWVKMGVVVVEKRTHGPTLSFIAYANPFIPPPSLYLLTSPSNSYRLFIPALPLHRYLHLESHSISRDPWQQHGCPHALSQLSQAFKISILNRENNRPTAQQAGSNNLSWGFEIR